MWARLGMFHAYVGLIFAYLTRLSSRPADELDISKILEVCWEDIVWENDDASSFTKHI